MRLRIHILICFLFLGYGMALAQETKEDIEKRADRHFKNEEFLEATPLYLRLLSLEPRNHNYNYRYGTCLLYNSKKKQSAFKYLSFAVQSETVEDEAFYYLGRAYHLTYQFKLAITNYKKYKSKAGNRAIARLDVDRQIEMCKNGLTLLSTITEKVVLSKREMVENDFFRIYDLSDIGGQIIVTEAFQNRQDVRNGHTPVIHFPAKTDKIFYSSYGDRDDHKDIYMRQRLPDNSWSKEQKVFGDVNTPYDEDFPYFHPNGKYLYFSSKGHNSMGGYDIFRAEFDEESNKFINVENMDFPISSPDDDLLYVVDSLNRLAYFSSKRESEFGKVTVYNVRVERFPVQIAVIKGTFNSTIDPSVKEMTVQVTDKRSGKRVGTFETNRKGEYLITLPKGGQFEFVINVDEKEDEFTYIIDVPLLKEFRPLKQRIEETTKDNKEIVIVYNLFDEEFDDPVAIMAEIIEAQSKMEINKGDFDLDSLDMMREQNKVLADLGLEGFTTIELIQMTDEKVNDIKLRIANSEQQLEKSLLQIEKSKRVKQDAIRRADSLMQLAQSESEPDKKERFVRLANGLISTANEQDRLIENAEIMADYMRNDIEKMKPILKKAEEFQAQIHAVDRTDNDAILAVIARNKSYAAEHLKEKTRVDATFELIEEITKKMREAEKLREKQRKLLANEEQLLAEIEQLEKDLPNAKRRQKDDMERELRQKQAQLEDLKSEQRYVAKQVENEEDFEAQRKAVDAIGDIDVEEEHNFIAENPLSKSDEEAKKRLEELNNESAKINKELGIDTDDETETTSSDEKEYVVDQNTPAINNLKEVQRRYNAGDTDADELINAYQERIQELKEERNKLQEKVDNQTASSSEKARINAIEKEIKEKENRISSLETTKTILAENESAFEFIEDETKSSSERMQTIDEAIEKLQDEKSNLTSSDVDYEAKKSAYDEVIEELESKKETIKEETEDTFDLSSAEKEELLANTSSQEKQAIINNVDADYQDEIAELQEQLERGEVSEQAVKERQQRYIQELENEAKSLTEKIQNGENVQENKQRLAVIEEEIENEKAIAREDVQTRPTAVLSPSEKAQILASTSSQEKQAIINNVDADYQEEIAEFQEQLERGEVSEKAVKERQQRYIQELENEAKSLTEKIQNGENVEENKQRLAVIEEEIENEKAIAREEVQTRPTVVLTASEKAQILASTSSQEKQAIIDNVDADYKEEIAELQEQLERGEVSEQAVKERQQRYIQELENEAKSLTEKIQNGENVQKNKQRLAVIEEEIENEKAIAREEVQRVSDVAVNRTEVINNIDAKYQEEIAELKTAQQNGEASISEIIERKESFQEKLSKEIEKTEKKLNKSPDNKALEKEVSILKEIAEELQTEIAESKQIRKAEIAQKVEALTETEKDEILDKVARKARIEIGELSSESKVDATKKPALLNAQKNYLTLLEKENLRLKEKVASGKASEEEEIQLALIEREKYKVNEAIKALEEELYVDEERFPDLADANLENEANLNQNEREALQSVNKDLFTLKNQLLALEKLEARLLTLKSETTYPEKLNAINQKIEEVKRKKRTAKITIGELEQTQQDVASAVETSSKNASKKERSEIIEKVNKIKTLDNEINDLKAAAQEENNERKQERLNKQIDKLEEKKTKEKVDLLEQTAEINQREIAEKIAPLDINRDSEVSNLNAKKAANNAEELIRQAEKAKNPAEKQRLLAEANREQKKAIEEAEEAERSKKFKLLIGDLSSDLSLNNIDEKTVKTTEQDIRDEQIQIGVKLREIDDRLKMIEINLANAKRKEAEQLEKLKEEYLTLKTALEAKQFENEDQLEAIEKERLAQRSKGVAEDAKTKPVTYQEEVEFAQTDAYRELFNVTNKLSQKQYELKVKEELIDQNKKKLNVLTNKVENLDNPSSEELVEIEKALRDIDRLTEETRKIKIEIGELQQEMAGKMPLDAKERKIAENLVSREVNPIKDLPRLPVMTTGLVLNDPNRRPYSEENPIPLEAEKPKGLVFRVQVGAFSRPVPNETFNDFSPVTGEEVRPGLIRYVAGYFGGREDATTARDQIRGLGYSDAFVVAYCDGERIPVYRAEQLMASGTCVPSIETPDNVIVSAEEAEREGRLTSGGSFEAELDEFAYNKAPGAAEAETAETKLGLYFTVQVGVYNKPVSAEQLKNISLLVTKRLPNGQIRYSSGIFENEQDAGVKRAEAVERGITDAFIVAYYKGERLTVGQARKLLEEHGEEILELRNPTVVRRTSVESPIAQPQEPDPEPYLKGRSLQVQWESYDRYEEYPIQVLNRYNQTEALFFFDWETGKIKSFVYPKENAPSIADIENELEPTILYENKRVLDREAILVENALNTVNTKVEALIVKVRFEDLNDDLVNYMIKLNASKTISVSESGLIIKIYDEFNGKKVNLNKIKIDFARFSATEFESKTIKLERND